MGDNGKLDDYLVKQILSPYREHRSALMDCEKLVRSDLGKRKAILMYGFDYRKWPLEELIEAFEEAASRKVQLSERFSSSFGGLIHPDHREGSVMAWELGCL